MDTARVGFTPFTDSKIVLRSLQPVLDQLQLFFRDASQRAQKHFTDRGWSMDANLFAYEVRKDVFERLRMLGAEVVEEKHFFEVAKMPLSGLLLDLPGIRLRIRKSKDNEIPHSGSDQLRDFYNWNLFAFSAAPEDGPLHLMLLWNVDVNFDVCGFCLVCPDGENEEEVKWKWREGVPLAAAKLIMNGEEFRTAFEEANSDVPLTPKVKAEVKPRQDGTQKSKK